MRVFLSIHSFKRSKEGQKKQRNKRDGWSISVHEILFPYPVITELELQDISVISDLLHKPESVFWHKHWPVFYFQQHFQEMIYKPVLPKGLWHYQWRLFKCKDCGAFTIVPAGWLRWWGIDVVEDAVSIFANAWNQLTEEKITHLPFSALQSLEICKKDNSHHQVHGHMKWCVSVIFSQPWIIIPVIMPLIFFPVFHPRWASKCFLIKGNLCL